MRPGAVIGPIILIGIGVLFLVNNLLVDIPIGRMLHDYWPFILIIVGLAQLPGAILGGPKGRYGYLSGSLIMITLGTLFAFQQLGDIPFRRTWPVLLVVIGVLGLLRTVFAPTLLAGRAARMFRGGWR